ncbi:DHH family phosphoesterase [Natronosalvus vescus]|uniref:DHH family phosphoesterase n=1 Tax=Natronosalvus vescus TaxID=2953881 RepID=UPI0020906F8C|nr:DHH family phosphoesterase [Natronosalvus vescus]
MVSRLVLGCGSVGQRVVERLRGRTITAGSSGVSPSVVVVTRENGVVETLREENVRARCADPADPEVLASLEVPDVVFVASDSVWENRQILEAARDAFPDAITVAYLPVDAESVSDGATAEQSDDRRAIHDLATTVVDSRRALTTWLLERTTHPVAQKAIDLRTRLARIDGTLAVVAHDNPDPDAIASAVALRTLAESMGVDAVACYYGEISHQENRAMINLLDLELRTLDPDEPLGEFDAFALVDHSRPGVNDQLPADLAIDIVIDHHPPRGPVPGEFYDLREGVGATSTIMAGHLDRFGLEIDSQIATALLYGIRVDTNDFRRELSQADFEAAALLWPRVDFTTLSRIEQPTIEGDTLETVARAIKNRTQRGSVVASSAGEITDRDALPQAAEKLLSMEGVDTTLVFGFREEMVYVSARARASDIDVGETLRDAFDQIGSAGGHADMAGAQLEMGILAETDDAEERESILSVVEEVITDRFFEAIGTRPGTPVGVYSQTSAMLFGSTPAGESDEDTLE